MLLLFKIALLCFEFLLHIFFLFLKFLLRRRIRPFQLFGLLFALLQGFFLAQLQSAQCLRFPPL